MIGVWIYLIAAVALFAFMTYMGRRWEAGQKKWEQSPEGIANKERLDRKYADRKPGEIKGESRYY